MESIKILWAAHKGKVKAAVAFIVGGLLASGYVVPQPVVDIINALIGN